MAKDPVYCRICTALIPGPDADRGGDVCKACREREVRNTGKPLVDRVALNLKTRLESELTAVEERLAHAEAATQHLEAALQVYDSGRGRTLNDLARRIHAALDGTGRGIAETEKKSAAIEFELEKARGELTALRTREQQLRETRLHMLQAKHLSGDLAQRLEQIHALLHAAEGAAADAVKPKADAAMPDVEKHLDAAEQAAMRGIREAELKLSHLEDQIAEQRTGLATHRAREQHLRAMDMQLLQARQLAEDLDRNLSALTGSIKSLKERTQALLTPAREEEVRSPKPEIRRASVV